MDAFETVISTLLRREGYWTIPNFKVELTKKDKQQIGRPSSPRWEIDLIAYNGLTNEVLAVECKSYLDSLGVVFRHGHFDTPKVYKLFVDDPLRKVVLHRLARQLERIKACRPKPKIQLCLAAGKIAKRSNLPELKAHFAANKWQLFDPEWITDRLKEAGHSGYENDVTFVVTKLLERNRKPS
jgi:hypothetical protein